MQAEHAPFRWHSTHIALELLGNRMIRSSEEGSLLVIACHRSKTFITNRLSSDNFLNKILQVLNMGSKW